MFKIRPVLNVFGALFLAVLSLEARTFTVAVYNLENFFDIDGVAAYQEYRGSGYTPAHLRTKALNAAAVISRIGDDGKGPDILLLQEVENDLTPPKEKPDYATLLRSHAKESVTDLLSGKVPSDAADWPAEAWLLKALEEKGLHGYTVVAGDDSATVPYEDGKTRSIKNVVLTRFPVKAVRNHPIANARNIIELQLDVDGKLLYVFSNHWKSGASDPKTELVRVENAKVLRERLDEILKADPHADIILGGDFNSQYNQKLRYTNMPVTAINDILGSQGSVAAVKEGKADLYNLWFALPPERRTSDTYRGEWGTLIQLIISRGLLDGRGIQYVDGSMSVAKFPGLNEGPGGLPVRWSFEGPAGEGFSDHFPIWARFKTIEDGSADQWLELKNPSDGSAPSTPLRTSAAKDGKEPQPIIPGKDAKLRDGSYNGKLLMVQGIAIGGQRLGVTFRGEDWEVYIADTYLRDKIRRVWRSGKIVRFCGELGQYKGRWQFVIQEQGWILDITD